MEELSFVKPTDEMQPEVTAFMDLFYDAGERTVNGSAGLDYYKEYEVWITHLRRIQAGEEEGLVPSVVYFVKNAAGTIVGVVDIRPALPEGKLKWGHIGYSVAPPYRRKGYGTAIVQWGLAQLRREGTGDVSAACYESNTASRKALKKAGFYETGAYKEEDTGKRIVNYTNIKEKQG